MAAASVLLNELAPPARGVVMRVAEGSGVEAWIAVLGVLERYAELVRTSALRST